MVACTVFIICLSIMLYIYIGYPVIIRLINVFQFKTSQMKSHYHFTPSISFIIAAYNEEKSIKAKIENTLKLDYPREKIEIIIVSDCSTDSTDNIVLEYQDKGIKLVRLSERKGKTFAQNEGVCIARHDYIVFSDATGMYTSNSVSRMISNFADPSIGCVFGRVEYSNEMNTKAGEEETLYWQYETILRECENRIEKSFFVSGSIYALRKKLYIPLLEDMQSDLITPMTILEQGARIFYEKSAVCIEKSSLHFIDEFERKRRIVLRGMHSLINYRRDFPPIRNWFLKFQILSHKIFRWLTPIPLIILFISNLFLLTHRWGSIFLICQICFYVVAIGGIFFKKINFEGKLLLKKVMYIPFYFCLLNGAVLMAFLDLFRGRTVCWWETRRNDLS